MSPKAEIEVPRRVSQKALQEAVDSLGGQVLNFQELPPIKPKGIREQVGRALNKLNTLVSKGEKPKKYLGSKWYWYIRADGRLEIGLD